MLYPINMFFDDYKNYPEAKLNPTLLWEYDINRVDYTAMRNLIVQRVIERGWLQDWYAMLNLYGVDGVANAIRELPYLNDKDMNFVSIQFDIPLSELKCYTRKQSTAGYWDS